MSSLNPGRVERRGEALQCAFERGMLVCLLWPLLQGTSEGGMPAFCSG